MVNRKANNKINFSLDNKMVSKDQFFMIVDYWSTFTSAPLRFLADKTVKITEAGTLRTKVITTSATDSLYAMAISSK